MLLAETVAEKLTSRVDFVDENERVLRVSPTKRHYLEELGHLLEELTQPWSLSQTLLFLAEVEDGAVDVENDGVGSFSAVGRQVGRWWQFQVSPRELHFFEDDGLDGTGLDIFEYRLQGVMDFDQSGLST